MAGAEFFILLGKSGVVRSSKWILWDDEDKIFFIRNYIDETEQELTEQQGVNFRLTILS